MPRGLPIAIVLLLLPSYALAAPPQVVGELPVALVGAPAVAVGDSVYVFGGRLADGNYTDAIYRHDLGTGAVTQAGTFPLATGMTTGARYSGAAVAVGTTIYHFGGTAIVLIDINGDGTLEPVPRALPDIVAFDTLTGSATTLVDRLPRGTWGMAGALVGDLVHLFGGFSFDYTDLPNIGRHDWVLRFDADALPGSRVTEIGATLPYAVQDAAAVVFGDTVYVAGGLSDHTFPVNTCPTYTTVDPETGQNETSQIQVCITSSVVAFDASTGNSSVVAQLPERAQFVSAAKLGEVGVIPGGLLADGSMSPAIVQLDLARPNPLRVFHDEMPQRLFGAGVATVAGAVHTYAGRVDAYNLTGEIVRIDPAGATRPAGPGPVRALAAVSEGGVVTLSWSVPAADPSDPAPTSYRLYRLRESTQEIVLGETTSTSVSDATALPDVVYRYRVVPVSSAGAGASAQVVVPTPLPPPTTAPSRPFGLRADAEGIAPSDPTHGSVSLRWEASLQDGGAPILGYRIYRSDDHAPPALLGTTLHLTFRDESAPLLESATYTVTAFNGAGASPPSNEATVAPEDQVGATLRGLLATDP